MSTLNWFWSVIFFGIMALVGVVLAVPGEAHTLVSKEVLLWGLVSSALVALLLGYLEKRMAGHADEA